MVYFIRRESDIKWAEDLDDGSNFLASCYHTSLQSDKTRIIVKIYRLLLYIDRDNINLNFQLILISNGSPHHSMPSLILLKLWLWSESFGPLNFSHEFQISLIFGLIFAVLLFAFTKPQFNLKTAGLSFYLCNLKLVS